MESLLFNNRGGEVVQELTSIESFKTHCTYLNGIILDVSEDYSINSPLHVKGSKYISSRKFISKFDDLWKTVNNVDLIVLFSRADRTRLTDCCQLLARQRALFKWKALRYFHLDVKERIPSCLKCSCSPRNCH